jgi:hypothetical protein
MAAVPTGGILSLSRQAFMLRKVGSTQLSSPV